MTKIFRALLALAIIYFVSGGTGEAETRQYTLNVNHLARTFLVHVPQGIKPGQKAPLVIALHGGATNASTMERFSGLSETAKKYGFVVVYPNGTGRLQRMLTWNSGNCCGYAQKQNIDDVAFIRDMIGYLTSRFNIDPSRVYATGISNGAMMAYRLAVEIPDKIAAVAAVSGTLNVDPDLVRAPMPILHFHGTEDQYVPFGGGHGPRSLEKNMHTSVMDTIKVWVTANDTITTPIVEELPDRYEDGTRIVRYTYKPKHDDDNIILYKIIGGGHTWPGRPHMKLILGTTTKEISANDIMWKFFSAHSRKPSSEEKGKSNPYNKHKQVSGI
jgi:polyhydroxybutyrate depolymerase